MPELRVKPRIGIHLTTVADLKPGDLITSGDLRGTVTSIEPGTWVGIWVDDSDMRWLLPGDKDITVKRAT